MDSCVEMHLDKKGFDLGEDSAGDSGWLSVWILLDLCAATSSPVFVGGSILLE